MPLEQVQLRPIGHVQTPYTSLAETPIQTSRNPRRARPPGPAGGVRRRPGGAGGLRLRPPRLLPRPGLADRRSRRPALRRRPAATGPIPAPAPRAAGRGLRHPRPRPPQLPGPQPGPGRRRPRQHRRLHRGRLARRHPRARHQAVRAPPGRARLHPEQRLARPDPRRLVPAAQHRRQPPRPPRRPGPPRCRPPTRRPCVRNVR